MNNGQEDQVDKVQIPSRTTSFRNDDLFICKRDIRNEEQWKKELQRNLSVRITDVIDVHTLPGDGPGNMNILDKDYGIFYHPDIWKRNISQYNLALAEKDNLGGPLFLKMEFLARMDSFKMNAFVEFFPFSTQREYFELGDIESGSINLDGVTACIMSCKNVPVHIFRKLNVLHCELVKIREKNKERMPGEVF
ncbi:hypothetical protein Btru_024575 [Bulinus truncatus]|nr:hypothetical protein Btru_024575 [Bulinus truncatus]